MPLLKKSKPIARIQPPFLYYLNMRRILSLQPYKSMQNVIQKKITKNTIKNSIFKFIVYFIIA